MSIRARLTAPGVGCGGLSHAESEWRIGPGRFGKGGSTLPAAAASGTGGKNKGSASGPAVGWQAEMARGRARETGVNAGKRVACAGLCWG